MATGQGSADPDGCGFISSTPARLVVGLEPKISSTALPYNKGVVPIRPKVCIPPSTRVRRSIDMIMISFG